jgi:hypothetical protein
VSSETKDSLLQDGIDAVPEGDGKVHLAVVVADTTETVLSPAIRSRSCVLVGEVSPGISIGRVVLPNGRLEPAAHRQRRFQSLYERGDSPIVSH